MKIIGENSYIYANIIIENIALTIIKSSMSGKRFGVKTSKTLRRCDWRDQAKEFDTFVVKHCAQYEGPELFKGDKIMVTDMTHERIDKSERKRLAKRVDQRDQLFNMNDLDTRTEFE